MFLILALGFRLDILPLSFMPHQIVHMIKLELGGIKVTQAEEYPAFFLPAPHPSAKEKAMHNFLTQFFLLSTPSSRLPPL